MSFFFSKNVILILRIIQITVFAFAFSPFHVRDIFYKGYFFSLAENTGLSHTGWHLAVF